MTLGSFPLAPPPPVNWRVAAGHWTTFRMLLFLLQNRAAMVEHAPSSRDAAAAVLHFLLDDAKSMRWCCQRGPLGVVPEGGSLVRARRLAGLIARQPALQALAALPPCACEPLLMLSVAEREDV